MYNPRMRPRHLIALSLTVALAGCSRDVKTDLEVVDIDTGWYNLGVVKEGPEQGKTKLVPGISIRLKNISAEPISAVELNAVFRHVEDEVVIDEHYVTGIPRKAPVAAGETSGRVVLRSKVGAVGVESLSQMLKNSHFKDVRVTILGRHGRMNWAPMAVVPIDRKLLFE
jgi:hypothetical protein